jgi:hypothetical protein
MVALESDASRQATAELARLQQVDSCCENHL